MKFFLDRKIKKIAKDENIVAPKEYSKMVAETLSNLKETEKKTKLKSIYSYKLKFAMAMIVLTFILLPNISPEIAYAMQEVPIIGNIVKVITIRNYFDKDGNSELDVEIPNIKNSDNSTSESNEIVNEEVNKLTQKIIDNFYAEKNPNNHKLIKVESDVIENSQNWFTLRLMITETAGSSDLQYKYYHIDKESDQIVNLSDLFTNQNYKDAISEEIEKQMISRMKENSNIIYWIDEEKEEWSFRAIKDNQNFYFSKDGSIVIVFDKYEVGPGSTGSPEFEINEGIYKQYLKEKYIK